MQAARILVQAVHGKGRLHKEVEGLLRGTRPYSDGPVKGNAVTHDHDIDRILISKIDQGGFP